MDTRPPWPRRESSVGSPSVLIRESSGYPEHTAGGIRPRQGGGSQDDKTFLRSSGARPSHSTCRICREILTSHGGDSMVCQKDLAITCQSSQIERRRPMHHSHRIRVPRTAATCAVIGAVALTAAGCASSGNSTSQATATATGRPAVARPSRCRPGRSARPGTIRYCSDISTPPLEFYADGQQATGSDVDLGNAVAAELGLKPVWVNTAFAGHHPGAAGRPLRRDPVPAVRQAGPAGGGELHRLHELERGRPGPPGQPEARDRHRRTVRAERGGRDGHHRHRLPRAAEQGLHDSG